MNRILLSGFVLLATVAMAEAKVSLPPIISSHMVLQRDMAVPIWGTADKGEAVTVKFRDQQKQTIADANGKWMVKLDPLQAGGPDHLTVNDVALEDVLVGEVWVGSGQSNMAMTSANPDGQYLKNDPVLASNVAAAPYPKIRLASDGKLWGETTTKNLEEFSALLFSFGLVLHKELDVPIGLVVGAEGGTPSGRWLSSEAFNADPGCKALIDASISEKAQKDYETDLAKWEQQEAEAKATGKKNPIGKPTVPKKQGSWGVGTYYEKHIRPLQPYGIRGVLWDQGESGTFFPCIDQYTMMGALIRGWRKEWAQGDFPFIYVQKPSGGGCSWDDKPSGKADDMKLPDKAPGAVDDPRARFYMSVEDHIRIKNYPNTAMAISSDLGPGIHPINKSGYGRRAATVALGTVYGKKVEYYGPLYDSHVVEDGKIRIKFTHVGQGLAFKHGNRLQGYAVAGEDKTFHWADAVIDGDTVVLSSTAVSKPVAVRYGWSSKRAWANLFNRDGLPAVPFRTDDW